MIGSLLKGIAGFFAGNGSGIGNAVANTATAVAVIAAIAPAVIWLISNKDEVFVSFTYGQTALFFGFLVVILKVVHYTRHGSIEDRQP